MVRNDTIPYEKILDTAYELAKKDINKLAEALGVSVATVYAWRNGTRKPSSTNKESIQEYINKHTKYEIPDSKIEIVVSDSSKTEVHDSTTSSKYILVPLMDDKLQPTKNEYAFREEWLKRITKNDVSQSKTRVFMYRNIGLQMKPLFSHEAMLLIKHCEILIHKKIYLIAFNGKLYVRRFFNSNNQYIFKVENEEFELQNFIFNERSDFTLWGEVIWFCNEL